LFWAALPVVSSLVAAVAHWLSRGLSQPHCACSMVVSSFLSGRGGRIAKWSDSLACQVVVEIFIAHNLLSERTSTSQCVTCTGSLVHHWSTNAEATCSGTVMQQQEDTRSRFHVLGCFVDPALLVFMDMEFVPACRHRVGRLPVMVCVGRNPPELSDLRIDPGWVASSGSACWFITWQYL